MNEYNAAVEKHKKLILDAHEYIWANPETGFKEVKTSKYLEDAFEKLGYEIVRAGNVPGFYTVIDTGRPGPEILVLGELDALICPEHPDADPETGAVHCCGHSAQSAALLGLAAALKEPGVLDELSGRIRLCAVPAEEGIELEFRESLCDEGVINYTSGKCEFLSRGYFDGVDMAFMVHTTTADGFYFAKGGVGLIQKRIIYKGWSSHAGASPWTGCNALYAAMLGLSAINSIRETFREPDMIRVHPIVTQGGNVVNAIPDRAVVESYVRGSTFDAMVGANDKVNRAVVGAALALGANVDIQDMPGAAPLYNDDAMIEMAYEAAELVGGIPLIKTDNFSSGSTDLGDLCTIMPVIHPYSPGACGQSHSANYYIKNPELACVASAKFQLNMLYTLLKNGGERAKKIKAGFKPMFKNKEEYFEYTKAFTTSGNRITYNDDKTALAKL